MRFARLAAVTMAGAILWAPGANGAAPKPASASDKGAETTDAAKARDHLGKANVHYDLQEYRKALIEFRAAYRLKNDPALLFNMGQCDRKVGQFREAIDFYKTYLRKLPSASNRSEVERLIGECEQAMKERKPEAAADGGASTATATAAANVTPPSIEPEATVPVLPAPPAAEATGEAGAAAPGRHPRRRGGKRGVGRGNGAAAVPTESTVTPPGDQQATQAPK